MQIIGTWILVSLYVVVILYFVIKGALKIKNISDYAVGNISFSPLTVGLALAASMTSAATFVINPGFIANYGVSGVISFGLVFPAASIISLIFLTKSFRKYGQNVKALTLAQWIGKRYNNEKYALIMAFLSLLLITFIVLIVVAITKVLSKALDADEMYVLISVITFTFGYMMFGGANSMVYTNTIQAVIMILVAIILLTSGMENFKGGIDAFLKKLSDIDPVLAQAKNPESLLFRDFYEIIFAQIIVGIAVVVQPHIITKSLLLKKEKDVNKFLTVAVIAEILFFAVVITGLYARITFPDLMFEGEALKSDGIIPAYVIEYFAGNNFSVIIGLIVILGLISAGLSTLEGLIQSVSASITTDIIRPLFKSKIKSEKKYITINKFTIVFLAIITFIIAYDQLLYPKLSVGILAQNGVYAYFSAAFIPVIFGIFSKNIKTQIVFAASIISIIVHFGIYYLLPVLHDGGLSFGYFDKFITGTIRNPAIAASSAILISSFVSVIWHLVGKNMKTK